MMCMKIKYSVYFINEIEQYTPSALDPDPLDNYRIRRHINRGYYTVARRYEFYF